MTASVSCLLCGSKNISHWANAADIEYYTTSQQFNYYRCNECHVLFIDPVPLNELEKIYPKNYYSFSMQENSLVNTVKEWIDQKRFKAILKKLPGNSLNILDVGGGAGWLLNILRSMDQRVVHTHVVDINPDVSEIAAKDGHTYFCGRIENFKSDVKFDLILLLNLVEHIPDPLRVLCNLQQMLSPGGLILVKTPNYDSLDSHLFRWKNWGGYHCPRHWILFNRKSFTELVKSANLKVVDFSYTQGAPFWTISLLHTLSKYGLVSINAIRPAFLHPLAPYLNILFAVFDFIRLPFSKTSQMFFLLRKYIK